MIEKAEITPTLQNIPWLMDLTPYQLDALRQISSFRLLQCGEILFYEGDSENLIYILYEGKLSIEITVPGHGQICIYEAEPLDLIGWDSMTPASRQRITSARAIQNASVIAFNTNALKELCERDPSFGLMLMNRISNVITYRMLSMRIKLLDLIIQN